MFVLTALLTTLLPAADPIRISDPNFHGWLMYFGDHSVNDKWGIHLEAQWRRGQGFNRWQQSFFRPAINYEINKKAQVTFGYGFAKTYPYGDFPVRQAFDEHRVYQQFVYRQPRKRVNFQYRVRFEQRWLDVQRQVELGPLPHEQWRLQNRLRLNFRMDVPLTPRTYLAFYNELMLHVPPEHGAAQVGPEPGLWSSRVSSASQLAARNGLSAPAPCTAQQPDSGGQSHGPTRHLFHFPT